MLNLRKFSSVFFFPISLFLASSYFIPEAKASCEYWTDKFGTSHEYCVIGIFTEYKRRFRNGTRTKEVCDKIGISTNCKNYTNGRLVGSQSCDNFGVSTTCRYKDSLGRTYKTCDYYQFTGWQCRDSYY